MLTVTENTTQQINAALFEQDQNVKNKLSTVSGVVSAVYGACEWIFNKLKESLARVATTGSYNDLTDKPTIVDTVAQNVPNAVSSNAVYGALANCLKKINNNISGTSEKDFIVNLASWLRSNISGSFIVTGSWSNHYHYVAQGVVNSDDANFIVLFSQQAYICYYLYGVDVYVKQLNTTTV